MQTKEDCIKILGKLAPASKQFDVQCATDRVGESNATHLHALNAFEKALDTDENKYLGTDTVATYAFHLGHLFFLR